MSSTYAAYEALVAALAAPALDGPVQAARREREQRTGECDSEDEGFEARMLAFWDAAVTMAPLLGALPPDATATLDRWVEPFARAHRGLFRVKAALTLEDLWSGAHFVLSPAPPAELGLALSSAEGVIDGRLVGRSDPFSVALLPGAFFHPADATAAIENVIAAAKKDGLSRDDTLDALLRMEGRLRAHSRVKPGYAYRVESLRR